MCLFPLLFFSPGRFCLPLRVFSCFFFLLQLLNPRVIFTCALWNPTSATTLSPRAPNWLCSTQHSKLVLHIYLSVLGHFWGDLFACKQTFYFQRFEGYLRTSRDIHSKLMFSKISRISFLPQSSFYELHNEIVMKLLNSNPGEVWPLSCVDLQLLNIHEAESQEPLSNGNGNTKTNTKLSKV